MTDTITTPLDWTDCTVTWNERIVSFKPGSGDELVEAIVQAAMEYETTQGSLIETLGRLAAQATDDAKRVAEGRQTYGHFASLARDAEEYRTRLAGQARTLTMLFYLHKNR